jgi:Na+/melibiose symporter-like transporter
MTSLFYLGSLLSLIGAIWFIVLSIQTGQSTGEKVIWALVNLICQPIGGIVFYFMKKIGLVPLLLVVAGAILTGIGYSSMMGDVMNQMPR